MSYLLLLLSLVLNGILIWYVRKMLNKLQYEVDVRVAFREMLQDYAASLENLYKLEELYGEEIIKRAIIETNFVIEACTEFKKAIEIGETQGQESDQDEGQDGQEGNQIGQDQEDAQEAAEEGYSEEEDDFEESSTRGQARSRQAKEGIIRLREGEKVSQDASSYRRVRPADFAS